MPFGFKHTMAVIARASCTFVRHPSIVTARKATYTDSMAYSNLTVSCHLAMNQYNYLSLLDSTSNRGRNDVEGKNWKIGSDSNFKFRPGLPSKHESKHELLR
jgi:hypothetical protein